MRTVAYHNPMTGKAGLRFANDKYPKLYCTISAKHLFGDKAWAIRAVSPNAFSLVLEPLVGNIWRGITNTFVWNGDPSPLVELHQIPEDYNAWYLLQPVSPTEIRATAAVSYPIANGQRMHRGGRRKGHKPPPPASWISAMPDDPSTWVTQFMDWVDGMRQAIKDAFGDLAVAETKIAEQATQMEALGSENLWLRGQLGQAAKEMSRNGGLQERIRRILQ